MRKSALAQSFGKYFSSLLSVSFVFAFFLSFTSIASAQTTATYPAQNTQPASYSDFRTPDVDPNVPANHHTYAQVVIIDVLSAVMCQLVGVDPVQRDQQCLGINPVTNKLGYAPQQFGQPQEPQQLGGALGSMTNLVSALYTPTISSAQYGNYLASNFGIVKTANASTTAPTGEDCSKNATFGYGFCGLYPIFDLWVAIRDLSYALLVIAFIFLGLGIMLRFKADPRTVMNLQNQIPRVIISILLITFSYAIAGGMIDIMWTVTYAGVNVIADTKDSMVRVGCGQPGDGMKLSETATNNLLDNPVSFANRILLPECENSATSVNINSGVVDVASNVKDSFITLVLSILNEFLGWDDGQSCDIWSWGECIQAAFQALTGLIIALIIIVAILVALFRLWFELIKAYVSFFIFVILGPIWIVMGLIPSRPLGFEKWFRLIFANLAAFPLVAFILVFARVLIDSVPDTATTGANSVFIPPLVGNPAATTFNALLAFGAILVAPSIPAMIRDRMKVGQSKLGASVAAGIGVAAGVASAPAAKTWKSMTRRNASTGEAEGALAVFRDRRLGQIPFVQQYREKKAIRRNEAASRRRGGVPRS